MLIAIILASLALATEPAAPVPAEDAASSVEDVAAPAARSAVADPDRLVCRRETKANSRFTTKVCKTAAEWEERTETARRAFAETQQRPIVSLDPGS
jgi:hypothetical protein